VAERAAVVALGLVHGSIAAAAATGALAIQARLGAFARDVARLAAVVTGAVVAAAGRTLLGRLGAVACQVARLLACEAGLGSGRGTLALQVAALATIVASTTLALVRAVFGLVSGLVALVAALGGLTTVARHVAHSVAFVAARGRIATETAARTIAALLRELAAGLGAFTRKVAWLLALVADVVTHFISFFFHRAISKLYKIV